MTATDPISPDQISPELAVDPLSCDETRHVIDFLVFAAEISGYAPEAVDTALFEFLGHDGYNFAHFYDDAMIRADRLAASLGYPCALCAVRLYHEHQPQPEPGEDRP